MNERKIASKILCEIENNGAYINIALSRYFNANTGLKPEEKGFISELVHGVTERKITLDYIISQFSSMKLSKISPMVLNAMRLGIYQILYMDKVPQSAAVNESVKVAKSTGGQRSGGFVNGVLRNIIRNFDNIKFPKEKNEYLSAFYSYPIEIVDLFLDEFGYDFTEEMLKSFYVRKPITIRSNALKTNTSDLIKKLGEDNVSASSYNNDIFPSVDYALSVDKLKDIENLSAYKNGEFYVQDIAAMLVTEILNPKENETVIDMCAAPGGKTTHICEKMNNTGEVYAFDVYDHKIKLINDNARRLCLKNCRPVLCDSTVYDDKYIEKADRVLIDAPCSGFGILSKKPDIKYQRNVEDISALSDISLKILENGAIYLKSGGTLVFSTCTILKSENEDVVNSFLAKHKNFHLEPITEIKKANNGYITLYPHIDGTDGFFICKMKKE